MFSEIVSKFAYTTFSVMNRLESIRLLKMPVKSCCVCQLPERMNTINKSALFCDLVSVAISGQI